LSQTNFLHFFLKDQNTVWKESQRYATMLPWSTTAILLSPGKLPVWVPARQIPQWHFFTGSAAGGARCFRLGPRACGRKWDQTPWSDFWTEP
jgi:hypothetical protein